MSPKLPRITATELIRALKRDGWRQIRRHGSHVIFDHPDKSGLVVVPMQQGKELRPGLMSKTLRDAGLTPDDLRRLL